MKTVLGNTIYSTKIRLLNEGWLLNERVTIPPNNDDEIEAGMRSILDNLSADQGGNTNFDTIIRWYRNEKKMGVTPETLKKTYVDNINNLIDYVSEYYKILAKKPNLANSKMPVRVPGQNGGPGQTKEILVSDFPKTRMREVGISLVNSLRQVATETNISGKTDSEYDLNENDKTRIKLLATSDHVMAWETSDFETTNKFVYHLWQNSNMNVAYGNPSINSPYCTRQIEHWNTYAKKTKEQYYRQIWFLKRFGNGAANPGDLNQPDVAKLYDSMRGRGPSLLIAMDDSGLDFLGWDDEKYDPIAGIDFAEEVLQLDVNILAHLNRNESIPKLSRIQNISVNCDGVLTREYLNKVIKSQCSNYDDSGLSLGGDLINLTISGSVNTIEKKCCKNLPLYSVTIPNTVTKIEDMAFFNCDKMRALVIPDAVTEIPRSMCNKCSRLNSVTLGHNVTSIGKWAFCDCTRLQSISIPNSVKVIHDNAFSTCTSLREITLPNTLAIIGEYAFTDCEFLSSVNFGNGLKHIGEGAFNRCYSLKRVILPPTIKEIGPTAFLYCQSISSASIPSPEVKIGDGAFYGCIKLVKIKIGNNAPVNGGTIIGTSAFSACRNITSITLFNSVTKVNDKAFAGCTNLKSIIIPNTITEFGGYVFAGCEGLTVYTDNSTVRQQLLNGEDEIAVYPMSSYNVSENQEQPKHLVPLIEFVLDGLKQINHPY